MGYQAQYQELNLKKQPDRQGARNEEQGRQERKYMKKEGRDGKSAQRK